jgi:phosphate transport system substrate-binding protein
LLQKYNILIHIENNLYFYHKESYVRFLLITTFSLLATVASAKDAIQLSGSSTVLPFATIAAESFGENSEFNTPIVEGGGTGAGIAKFCETSDADSIDIANASRKMKSGELSTCTKNNVTDVLELRIGYDGIVFASAAAGPEFAFTPSDWFNALAAEVEINGKLVSNPYTRWSEIDPKLPDQEIMVFIPGTKHGTREVFDLKVITVGCTVFKTDKLFKARDGKADACTALRQDGRAVEIDGDYTETLQRLNANPEAVGVFGLSFYENNTDKLRVATFQGVTPTRETIASGEYRVSRPLFIYVKTQHYNSTPGLKEFVEHIVSDDLAGPEGIMVEAGLVSDPKLAVTQASIK